MVQEACAGVPGALSVIRLALTTVINEGTEKNLSKLWGRHTARHSTPRADRPSKRVCPMVCYPPKSWVGGVIDHGCKSQAEGAASPVLVLVIPSVPGTRIISSRRAQPHSARNRASAGLRRQCGGSLFFFLLFGPYQ